MKETLNAEQIIKALECCTNKRWDGMLDVKCKECPFEIGYENCKDLDEQALSLIKELTEENERLEKALNKALNTDISIVRVCSRGSGKTAYLREVGRIKADAIRASAVRDMQKRFNEKVAKLLISPSIQYQANAFIDRIAKEILEGK